MLVTSGIMPTPLPPATVLIELAIDKAFNFSFYISSIAVIALVLIVVIFVIIPFVDLLKRYWKTCNPDTIPPNRMKWSDWIEKWDMTSLKINVKFLEMEWKPLDSDREAAWELYVELLTRIATQSLDANHGDEKTALDSMYSLFPLTRQVLKNNSRKCTQFTRIAIIVLNQVIRPFTAKWHRLSLQGAFKNTTKCSEFRIELLGLQKIIKKYAKMLADMAGVEDLTALASDEPSDELN
ncbi:MAG: hypothetical protein LBH31_05720 [Burkholderiaceae bacterium]|jgi:hypothetical protein|nr:hypothetical protein [Burkholderiaceae bacterium]